MGSVNTPLIVPTSDELIETYRRTGRPEDFEQIVRRYAALVLAECRRVTRNSHDAEDASQLAFLALAMEIRTGANIARLGPWLQRVARNQSVKIVRSGSRRRNRENIVRRNEAHHSNGNGAIDQELIAGIIRDAIDDLPERYRLPLVLHYFGGLSLDFIAKELKASKTAVGTRLHRGRKMLGERLAKHGITLSDATLAAVVAFFVPAAVIDAVVRTASHLPTAAVAATGLPAAVTAMLHTVSLTAARRPLTITIAAAVLGAASTGVAWMGLARTFGLPKPSFDLKQWINRIFTPTPRLSDAAPPRQIEQPYRMHIEFGGSAFAPNLFQSPQWTAFDSSSTETAWRTASSEPLGLYSTSSDAMFPNLRAASMSPTPVIAAEPFVSEVQVFATRSSPTLAPPSRAIDSGVVELRGHNEFSSFEIGGIDSAVLRIGEGDSLHADSIRIGGERGTRGVVQQLGGNANARQLVVGDYGDGVYDLQRGRLNVGNLMIAAKPQSRGEVRIGAGEVTVTEPDGNVTVGGGGSGKLLLGTQDAPGNLTAATDADVSLIIRATQDARGLVQGWGTVGTGGQLINNGKAIADGFDHLRALDLRGFSSVVNTIENPRDGDNGWFVQRGGRLTLPTMRFEPGTQTRTWGESENDDSLDLINSLRITAHDVSATSELTVSLRTIALADPLDISLPGGISILGLWNFEGDNFDPSMLDITARYNAAAAEGFFPGEYGLQLIGYNGTWNLADSFWINTDDNLIGGSFDGRIEYLAVAMAFDSFWMTNDDLLAPLPNGGSSIPEPAAVLVVSFASLLARRRVR